MTNKSIKVGIVAGEASGDTLAAGMMRCLKQQYPNIQFEGIGGPLMIAQGCDSLIDMDELSVMGLVEVLSRVRRLLDIRKHIIRHFSENPPDIFIGVDAPDFNLTVEAKLKAKGIKTVHYVSPTVWAWREKRIHKIAKATDLVLGIFPFEHQVYDKYQLPYQYVGHTLADEIPLTPDQALSRQKLNVQEDAKVLALLPGSRKGEVAMLLDVFVQSAQLVKASVPDLKILIPVVNKARKQQVEQYLNSHQTDLDIQVVIGHSREVMIAADAILLASGTATLEAMLCKRPMVVAYKLRTLTYYMMKRMYKPAYFALPNILANQELVPELLQDAVNPENIASKLTPMLTAPAEKLDQAYLDLHRSLRCDADQQAANAVSALLNDA